MTEGQLRVAAKQSPAKLGFLQANILAVFLLFLATLGGCSTSNYAFDAVSETSGPLRAKRLIDDLSQEQKEGEDQELYDFEMFPLVYTHLKVFAESDDKGISEGFVEADIDSYLPLFGIVDAAVTRYDSERRVSEHHEFHSYLWGIFQSHRELVDTRIGMRETRVRRFLWLLPWSSSTEYTAPAAGLESQ